MEVNVETGLTDLNETCKYINEKQWFAQARFFTVSWRRENKEITGRKETTSSALFVSLLPNWVYEDNTVSYHSIIYLLLFITFEVIFLGICEEIMVGTRGHLKSPNITQIKSLFNGSVYKCKWSILLPVGIIKITFRHFKVGTGQILEKCSPNVSLTITDRWEWWYT